MRPRLVLDAWALLAFLQGEEPAAAKVMGLLEDARSGTVELYISVINLGEVVYRIGKVAGEEQAYETLEEIRRLPLMVVPAGEEAVFAAVRWKIRYAISYADAFAAATAETHSAALVTGDPELVRLQGKIQIEKIERR